VEVPNTTVNRRGDPPATRTTASGDDARFHAAGLVRIDETIAGMGSLASSHRSVLASRRQRAVHLHGLGHREEALSEIDAVISLETADRPADDPGLAASREVRDRIVGDG
jgi:hypothetical protein